MMRHRSTQLLALVFILCMPRLTYAQDWIYSTQPGDTLWDLCIEYTAKRGCWIELGNLNNITNGRTLQPGTDIRIPVAWLLQVPIVGTVVSVQGEAYYQVQHGSRPEPLVAGQNLALGGEITTRAGTARIALGNHSEFLLRPNSVLELSSMNSASGTPPASELQLDRGEIEVEVQPDSKSRFEIHTPSAIAAVRGTSYRVASQDRDATRSEVLTGTVAVSADATVEVPAGFGLKAIQGKNLGTPKKLPPAPVFTQTRVDSPLPLVIHWARGPDVVAWQLDLYSQQNSSELLGTYRTTDPELRFDALTEGCYRVVARAVDTEGFNGLESELPFCVEPAVEEPKSYWGVVLWAVFAAFILI